MSALVIVWRNRALGDSILSLPALSAVRQYVTDGSVRVIGYPNAWRVVGKLVDEVWPIEETDFAALFDGSSTPALRRRLSGVDAAVALTSRPFGPPLRAAGIPRVVQSLPYPPPGVHAADWLLQQVRAVLPEVEPVVGAVPRLDLEIWELEEARMRLQSAGLHHPVIIHPSAGEVWKRWPVERFARLMDGLSSAGYRVAVVEGPADTDVVAELRRLSVHSFPILQGSPRRLAALLAQGVLYIGNDSGVTHLAAAAGARVLAIFGPTDPRSWTPRGDVVVLRACAGQAKHQGQIRACQDPECLYDISVDAVLAAAHRRIHREESSEESDRLTLQGVRNQ